MVRNRLRQFSWSFAIFLFLASVVGCPPDANRYFAIHLAASDSVLITDEDITSYEASTQTFILTMSAAARLQSYQTGSQIYSGLYQQAFVVKLRGEEIYRGKFWSNISSLSEDGIVMIDVVTIGPTNNKLIVACSYPSEAISPENRAKINDPLIIEYFRSQHKLK